MHLQGGCPQGGRGAWRTVGELDGEIKYGRLPKPGQTPGDVVFAEKIREDRMRDTGLEVARWTWDELGSRFTPVAERIRPAGPPPGDPDVIERHESP